MRPNCYVTSVDLKDAYYSLPTAYCDRQYGWSELTFFISGMWSAIRIYSRTPFILVYQWSHVLLLLCFCEYFKFTSSVHSYLMRQSCNRSLYVPSVNTTQYGLHVCSLKFTGPRLWNSLPTSITNSNFLRIFR